MAAVQCQRIVTGSVRFSSQAAQVQTLQSELSSKEQQDIVTASIGSATNGQVSRGSSIAFPNHSAPPIAVATTNAPSKPARVLVPSYAPPFGDVLQISRGTSRASSYVPQVSSSIRLSSAPFLQATNGQMEVISTPEACTVMTKKAAQVFAQSASVPCASLPFQSMSSSLRAPPEVASGVSLRAQSPTGEQRRPSPSRGRRSSVVREQSPGRARSPIRDSLGSMQARCVGSSVRVEAQHFVDVSTARPRSPIRDLQEQSFEQVLLDAVARGRHASPRRQSSPMRQTSPLRHASPLRQTSSIQREQSPVFRSYGSSVRMTSASPLRANCGAVSMPGSYSSVRFQSQSPVSPRRPMPTSDLVPPPLFTAPPPALPSVPASSRGAPGVTMPSFLPLQTGQLHSEASRLPGLSAELTKLLANFKGFRFTAEPEGAAGMDPLAPPRIAPAAMDEAVPPPRSAPAVGSSLLDFSRERVIHGSETFLANSESFLQQPTGFEAPYGRSLAPPIGEGSDRHILSVMTSDNTWDSIAFHSGDNIEKTASDWIQKRGLNPAFQRGLVAQMRQMVKTKLITAAVDIVDLL